MNVVPAPYALGSEEGEAFWFFGGLVTVKATAEQSGGRFALTEQLFPGGMATPLHSQPEDDESFYVLEGEVTFYLEDRQPILTSAGSFVHVPAGVAHAFQVDSETARILNVTTAQHERFFRATSDPAQTRTLPPEEPPDMDRIMAAAQEYGVGDTRPTAGCSCLESAWSCPYSPNVGEGAFSEAQAVGSTHFRAAIRTDNAPRVRFSATVAEEPEIEVGLV